MVEKLYLLIRITTSDRDGVNSFCQAYSERYVLAWEVGSSTAKDHCHIYLETKHNPQKLPALTYFTRNTLVTHITSHWGKGNEHYSTKACEEQTGDAIKAVAYVIKEDLNPVFVGLWPEEYIAACRARNLEVKETTKDSKTGKKSALACLKDEFSKMADQGLSALNQDHHTSPTPSGSTPIFNSSYIIYYVIDWYKANDKRVSASIMSSDVSTLCLTWDPSYRRSLFTKIFNMTFPPLNLI